MIKLKKDSIIYVLCPANVKTGGPELLHQLVYKLNNLGFKSYIAYFECNEENDPTPADFKKYINEYKIINEIEDNEKNLLIFPEANLEMIRKFKYIRKVLWWLSVDNYINKYETKDAKRIYGVKQEIINILKNRIKYRKDVYKYDYHLCQSQYAIDYLKNKKITKNVFYLSDYINSDFFEKTYNARNDKVLYNPKKGMQFTKKIIEESNNLNWIAIQGLTTKEVRDLLLTSKVYIDFGNHPGKDRFPREAAISGCCVITGRNGSARNDIDVPIKAKYKFDRNIKNINPILMEINNCINEYEEASKDFDNYRKIIMNDELKFENDIINIFKSEEK